jgi:hypothetical protein
LGIYWNKDRNAEAEDAAAREAKAKPARRISPAHHHGRAWTNPPVGEGDPDPNDLPDGQFRKR